MNKIKQWIYYLIYKYIIKDKELEDDLSEHLKPSNHLKNRGGKNE